MRDADKLIIDSATRIVSLRQMGDMMEENFLV